MCDTFSGHIVSDKESKKFGEVIYLSGIHHEKDRAIIYKKYGKIKLASWTTIRPNTFSGGIKIMSSEGDLTKVEKKELIKLLNKWSKNQDEEKLFLNLVSITQKGKPLSRDKFTLDLKNSIFATSENNLVLDFYEIRNCTFKTGSNCTFTTGSNCIFKTGSYCTFDTEYSCTFKTGSDCTFKTENSCTFDTKFNCNFKTGSNCSFDTGINCTITTGYNCTFNTKFNCTFKTGSDCTFNTGSDCTFKTGSDCTFTTGYNCTFTTISDCTFKTGIECICVRRDVYEVIEIPKNKTIKLNKYGIKGFKEIK